MLIHKNIQQITLFFKRGTYNANYFKRSYCSIHNYTCYNTSHVSSFFLTQLEQLYILYFIPQI